MMLLHKLLLMLQVTYVDQFEIGQLTFIIEYLTVILEYIDFDFFGRAQ